MSGPFDINLIVFVLGIFGVAFGLTALGLRRAERKRVRLSDWNTFSAEDIRAHLRRAGGL